MSLASLIQHIGNMWSKSHWRQMVHQFILERKKHVATKDCVHKAVPNRRNAMHACKIVQRSGIIFKRAMQIMIKSGPRVIIRARG